ncbi:MAG: DUF3800 domain-containing protein [Gemmatimonadetes bacterium]|nr:DUF3800 domain-containing protein [Gemmatimonadota bacterium]
MARVYVFADESGDFVFARTPNASKYFLLTTLTVPDCSVGSALLDLRRELAWSGEALDREFHATTDQQAIRDRVFALLSGHTFRVDATIVEKSKAQPHLRSSQERFYQYAWFYHFKHIAPKVVRPHDELLVVGASVGVKKQRAAFYEAVRDVVNQVTPTVTYQVASWTANSEPCLQAVDYCAWAIQRKWEKGDPRSHVLISSKVHTEFDIFKSGTTHHY